MAEMIESLADIIWTFIKWNALGDVLNNIWFLTLYKVFYTY